MLQRRTLPARLRAAQLRAFDASHVVFFASASSQDWRFACEERDYKGLHAFPSNITRDDPPITRDYTPFLQMLQGMTLQLRAPICMK